MAMCPWWLSNLNLNPASLPVFQSELISLAKQCDLPVRKVERWFRRRRNTDRPSLSKKFCEAWWAGAEAISCRGLSLALRSVGSLLPPSLPCTPPRRASWVFPALPDSSLALLLLLYYWIIPCFSPLFSLPRLLLLLSHLNPYRTLVSDFVRLMLCFRTLSYLKNFLLFCFLLLPAALLLLPCLQNSLPLPLRFSLCFSVSWFFLLHIFCNCSPLYCF